MGTAKPLLIWRGQPLVRYMVETLHRGGAANVTVVVADTAVEAATGAPCVWNSNPERGMLSSVQCALTRLAPDEALLVCPCDLPRLRPEQVRAVCDAWDGSDAAIVVPVFGELRGHPTLFGPKVARRIAEMDPEIEGLNALVRRHDGIVTVPVADDGPTTDADTPAAWEMLVRREGIEDAVE